MFKIENLKLANTAEFEVTHPVTGEVLEDEKGNKVILTVYGSSSRQHRQAVEKMVRKKNARGRKEPTLAEQRAENIEFLADLSISISNLEYDGVEGVEGRERFVQLYSDDSLSWLRDFASESLGDIEAFLQQ